MTVRLKTIEYSFPTSETSLASATRRDFSAITIYIPETASRVFTGVAVIVTCRDAVTTATSLTAMLIGCKLGAAAFSDQAITQTIANTGEQQSYMFSAEFALEFNTNFGSGTSQTLQVGVRFTGPSVINIAVKVIITYSYDDATAGDTRIKTVRIPIESPVGAMATSLSEWGLNQVPNLDTFLPEASKVYRDIFFELWLNEATNTTTDSSLGLGLDSESVDNDGLHENGLNSACWYHYIWKRTDMATNATHAFKSQAPAAMPCNHAACVLVVTYEYNHTNSTSIMNSLMLPFKTSGTLGATYDYGEIILMKFLVTENNVSLKQSGVVLFYLTDSGMTVYVSLGSQPERGYTDPSVLFCGGTALCHRIDADAAEGAGITLARGENTLQGYVYSSSNTVIPSAIGGFAIINYTSDKASSGADSHNHTLVYQAVGVQADALMRMGVTGGVTWLNTWYINHAGAMGYDHQRNTNKPDCAFFLILLDPTGWIVMGSMLGRSDVEVGPAIYCFDFDMKRILRHYDQGFYPSDLLGISAVDQGWAIPQSGIVAGAFVLMTISQLAWIVSGSVSNYSGDGSGLQVDIHRKDTGEKVLQATTVAGGTFSKAWFENTIALKADVRQSATLNGRSDDGVAT